MCRNFYFLIVISLFISYPGYAQDVPAPCTTDYSDPSDPCYTPWTGPLYDTLSSGDFTYMTFTCDTMPCEYYIVYYERIVDCPDPEAFFYDYQIVQITPCATPGCRERFESNKDAILQEFTYRKFNENADLFEDVWDDGTPDGDIYCVWQQHRVTLGACYYMNDTVWTRCSAYHCCATWLKVCFYDNGIAVPGLLRDMGTALYDDTDEPLQCDNVTIGCPGGEIQCDLGLMPDECDMPCNYIPWEQSTSYPIDVDTCPDCQITIHYRYRTATDCSPEFNDYFIDSMDISDECLACYGSYDGTEYLLQFAMNWLMKNGELDPPGDYECDTNWRMVTASCWTVPEADSSDSPSIHPCVTDQCCWNQYIVCNLGEEKFTYERIYASQSTDSCPNPPQPCVFVCDVVPVDILPRIGTEELDNNTGDNLTTKSWIIPNPSTGKLDIHLQTNYHGELKIEIYDINGKSVYSTIHNQNYIKTVVPIDMTHMPPGLYQYRISLGANLLDTGKITISK